MSVKRVQYSYVLIDDSEKRTPIPMDKNEVQFLCYVFLGTNCNTSKHVHDFASSTELKLLEKSTCENIDQFQLTIPGKFAYRANKLSIRKSKKSVLVEKNLGAIRQTENSRNPFRSVKDKEFQIDIKVKENAYSNL